MKYLLLLLMQTYDIWCHTYNVITIAGHLPEISFRNPKGMALARDGSLLVADMSNDRICRIHSTQKFCFGLGLKQPYSMETISNGNILVVDSGNNRIVNVETNFSASTVFYQNGGLFNLMQADILDGKDGNYYLTAYRPMGIHAVDYGGLNYSVVAGNGYNQTCAEDPLSNWVDGQGTQTKFCNPEGIARDKDGNIYVADMGNNVIRKVDTKTRIVSTLSKNGSFSSVLRRQNVLQFSRPADLLFDGDNCLIVAESDNNMIVKVMANGEKVPIAGKIEGGSSDGEGTQAQFSQPHGLLLDNDGNIYVSEGKNGNRIRKIIICNQTMMFNSSSLHCESPQCQPGYEWTGRLASCQPCKQGFYKATVGADACTPCGSGLVSNEGKSKCVVCASNSIINSNGQCENCGVGKEPSVDKDKCNPCQQNYYKPSDLIDMCILCPNYAICNSTSFTCLAGYETSVDNTGCVPCSTGFFRPSIDLVSCIRCPSNANCQPTSFTCINGLKPKNYECVKDMAVATFSSNIKFQTLTGSTLPNDKSDTSLNPIIDNTLFLVGSVLLLLSFFTCIMFSYKLVKRFSSKKKRFTKESGLTDHNLSESRVMTDTSSKSRPTSNSSGIRTVSSYDSTKAQLRMSKKSIRTDITLNDNTNGLYIPAFLSCQHVKDYNIDKKLTDGAGASIFIATAFERRLSKFGPRIIVKQFTNIDNEFALDAFFQEISLMYMLRDCKYIAKLLGYCENPYTIVIKYYPKGSLHQFLLAHGRVKTTKMLLRFVKNISEGIEYMVKSGLAHCDLKTSNVLMDIDRKTKESYCVLSDFGLSCAVGYDVLKVQEFHAVNIPGASLTYASPETLVRVRKAMGAEISYNHEYHPFTSDIYSLGIIIFTILTRNEAWSYF